MYKLIIYTRVGCEKSIDALKWLVTLLKRLSLGKMALSKVFLMTVHAWTE